MKSIPYFIFDNEFKDYLSDINYNSSNNNEIFNQNCLIKDSFLSNSYIKKETDNYNKSIIKSNNTNNHNVCNSSKENFKINRNVSCNKDYSILYIDKEAIKNNIDIARIIVNKSILNKSKN